MRSLAAASAALALSALGAAPATLTAQAGPAVDTVPIQEWTVPWEKSRPRDPAVAEDGRIWFVGQAGNYIAVLEPSTGEFERYEIEPGTHPHNLVLDDEGQIWYAGNRNGRIGRLDPATREVEIFPMPDSTARDPHTLVFGPDGTLWFSVQQGNYVGRLDTATGEVRLAQSPTAKSRPYGIVVGSDGQPWFTEFGSNRIATIDPRTMKIREYELPAARARPRRLALTSDGTVWYVDYTRGYLGRLDPETGTVEEWKAPSGEVSLPYGMTVDDEDRLWFVETGVQPNQLVSFDPRTERFTTITPIAESGGGTVRHMVYDAESDAIWFGTDRNTIGRASTTPRDARQRPVP